jgi:hypothetical protein
MSTAAVPAFVSGCRGHGDEPYGRRDRARQPYVVARWLVLPPRTQQSPEAVRVIALDAEGGLVLDQVPPRLSRVRRYLVGMLAFVTLSNQPGGGVWMTRMRRPAALGRRMGSDVPLLPDHYGGGTWSRPPGGLITSEG